MLRPGNLASNSLRWVGTIRAQDAVVAAYGDPASTVIDPRDIAVVAAQVLTSPVHERQTYMLTGPEMLTTRQQV